LPAQVFTCGATGRCCDCKGTAFGRPTLVSTSANYHHDHKLNIHRDIEAPDYTMQDDEVRVRALEGRMMIVCKVFGSAIYGFPSQLRLLRTAFDKTCVDVYMFEHGGLLDSIMKIADLILCEQSKRYAGSTLIDPSSVIANQTIRRMMTGCLVVHWRNYLDKIVQSLVKW
jgi:hypothetical protein